ncbi:hypothetical protein MIR68_000948 [Amoeboaphelidium protococcarum]|nr:hypothetical protein MIR68_000948 [Amoeboaphelidium protococcarum]
MQAVDCPPSDIARKRELACTSDVPPTDIPQQHSKKPKKNISIVCVVIATFPRYA